MFAVLNEITMFAMRQTHRTARRSDGITYSADKAGLISGISSGNSRCGFVAELGNSSAYSLYTYQIFRPCDKPRRICSKTYQIRPEHAIAVRKQLNLSYPFLTRKSFFAFNPLHRTNCVISSRYFVQPCMSLQCDNQNGCMKTVFRNISEKCLRNQKFCVHLSLANGLRLFASQPDILNTADKAAIPGCNSTRVVLTVCQNTKGVVASFYIKQILHQWQTVRILQPAHKVRPLQRKSVRKSLNLSLIFLTRKSSIVSNLFQRVRSAISLRCSVSFSVCS